MATEREYGGKDDVMVVAAQFVSEYYEKFTSALTMCSSMYGKTGRVLVSGPATPGGVPTTYEGQTEIIKHFDILDKYFGTARKACIRSVEAVMGALGCVVILVEGAIYTPAADTEFTTTFVLAPNDLRAATTIEFHIASEALRFVRVNKNNALPAASTVAASSMPAQQAAPAQTRPVAPQRTAPAPAPVKKVFNETEEEEARKATPPPAEAPKERKPRERKERAPREKKAEEEAAAAPANTAAAETETKKDASKKEEPKEAPAKPQAEKKERDDKPREKKERAPREKKEKKEETAEPKKEAAPAPAAEKKPEKKEPKKKEEAPKKEEPKPAVVEEPKVDKSNPWGNRRVLTTADATAATQAAAEANKKASVPAKRSAAAAAGASSSTAGPSRPAATGDAKFSTNIVVLRDIPKEAKLDDVTYYAEPFGKVKKVDRLGANHATVEFKYDIDAKAMVEHKDFTMFKQPVRVQFFKENPVKRTAPAGEKRERPARTAEKKEDKPVPANPAPKSATKQPAAAEAPKQTEKKERAPRKDRKEGDAKPKAAQ